MHQRIDSINGGIMHVAIIVVVLGLPVLIVTLIVLMVTAQGRPPHDHDATVVAARRHETRNAAAAVAASVCAALALGNPALASVGPPGVLLGVAPFVAALTYCLARAVGETRWPRPSGEVRSAPLVRRSVRDQGGWPLPLLLATVGGFDVALVALGFNAADDGRSVERMTVSGDTVIETHSAGPYPGWEFGVPVLLVLLLVVGAMFLALRAVTRRPPIGLLSPAQDDAIRRTSAARVLAGTQVWVGLGAAGHLAFAAAALLRVDVLTGGIVCAVAAVAVFAASLVIAAVAAMPRRAGVDATALPATPSGPAA
jgi:hypothetical protein